MNGFLIFLITCYLFSIGNCLNSENQYELICKNYTFHFEDKSHNYDSPLVNTFYRLIMYKDLNRFKNYLIEYDSEFTNFLIKNGTYKLSEYTEKYNRVILDVLNEKTGRELYPYSLINLHQMNFKYYKELILTNLIKIQSIKSEEEMISEIIEKCKKRFSKADDLFEILLKLKNYQLTEKLISEKSLKKIFEIEQIVLPEHLRPVFKEEPFSVYFNKKIVKFDRFKMNSKSQLFFSKQSYLTLYYTIYIPFSNKYYEENASNCTLNSNLPNFYKN